ncbi:hypothetical protein TWF481_001933 [Arthrobotrys musiformis]|uniref:C2H2-type domain-containing protein n=1 Tax=Arthrobotrys musiformis TaxID=47236 RepID=A0AAV9VW28_9PEZI
MAATSPPPGHMPNKANSDWTNYLHSLGLAPTTMPGHTADEGCLSAQSTEPSPHGCGGDNEHLFVPPMLESEMAFGPIYETKSFNILRESIENISKGPHVIEATDQLAMAWTTPDDAMNKTSPSHRNISAAQRSFDDLKAGIEIVASFAWSLRDLGMQIVGLPRPCRTHNLDDAAPRENTEPAPKKAVAFWKYQCKHCALRLPSADGLQRHGRAPCSPPRIFPRQEESCERLDSHRDFSHLNIKFDKRKEYLGSKRFGSLQRREAQPRITRRSPDQPRVSRPKKTLPTSVARSRSDSNADPRRNPMTSSKTRKDSDNHRAEPSTLGLEFEAHDIGKKLRDPLQESEWASQGPVQEATKNHRSLGDDTLTGLLERMVPFGAYQDAVFRKQNRLRRKANTAYMKLKSAASYGSDALKRFVSELVDLDNIFRIGHETLLAFIDEDKRKIPNDLKSLYCMLHLCYAMSQSTDINAADEKDTEFAKSASEWKDCLPEIPSAGVDERSLFDELISVMWDEMKEAWDFMERSAWGGTLGPDYAMFDPAFALIDDFDTGDLLGGLSDLLVGDRLESLEYTTPEHMFRSVARPSWESLSKTLVITIAAGFIRGLQESCGIFIYGSNNVVGPVLHTDSERLPALGSKIPDQLALDIDLDGRHEVVAFLKDSLPQRLLPILNAASSHFLKGVISTLRDLQGCMVAFLAICCVTSHAFLYFSDIIHRSCSYYYTHSSWDLGCYDDIYNTSDGRSDDDEEEEEKNLEPYPSLVSRPSSGSGDTGNYLTKDTCIAPNPTEIKFPSQPGNPKPPESVEGLQPLEPSAGKRKRPKPSDITQIKKAVEPKWINITGPPKKRRRILQTLPRATTIQ